MTIGQSHATAEVVNAGCDIGRGHVRPRQRGLIRGAEATHLHRLSTPLETPLEHQAVAPDPLVTWHADEDRVARLKQTCCPYGATGPLTASLSSPGTLRRGNHLGTTRWSRGASPRASPTRTRTMTHAVTCVASNSTSWGSRGRGFKSRRPDSVRVPAGHALCGSPPFHCSTWMSGQARRCRTRKQRYVSSQPRSRSSASGSDRLTAHHRWADRSARGVGPQHARPRGACSHRAFRGSRRRGARRFSVR